MDEKTTDMPAPPPGANVTDATRWLRTEIKINVKFEPPPPPKVYVVKVGNGYMRLPSSGGFLMVSDRRLATRLDSKLWALTVSMFTKDGRVVRLRSTWEREIEESTKKSVHNCVWTRNVDVKETKPTAPPPLVPDVPPPPPPATTPFPSAPGGG